MKPYLRFGSPSCEGRASSRLTDVFNNICLMTPMGGTGFQTTPGEAHSHPHPLKKKGALLMPSIISAWGRVTDALMWHRFSFGLFSCLFVFFFFKFQAGSSNSWNQQGFAPGKAVVPFPLTRRISGLAKYEFSCGTDSPLVPGTAWRRGGCCGQALTVSSGLGPVADGPENILPCGFKIAQHPQSAEWGNVKKPVTQGMLLWRSAVRRGSEASSALTAWKCLMLLAHIRLRCPVIPPAPSGAFWPLYHISCKRTIFFFFPCCKVKWGNFSESGFSSSTALPVHCGAKAWAWKAAFKKNDLFSSMSHLLYVFASSSGSLK